MAPLRWRALTALGGLGLASAASQAAPAPDLESQAGAPKQAAAAASWPIFRGDPALTGVAQTSLPDAPALLWSFEAGGAITSSPVVAEGRVFFGADDSKVHALGFERGEELWSYTTQDLIEAPPLVVGGVVYAGSSDGFLYALDAATGALRWRFETGDRVLGSANHAAGPEGEPRIVVGSYDMHLYCLDAKSGKEIWRYKTDNFVNGTPAVEGGRVVFGGCDAGLHVVSVAGGAQLARVDLGQESYVAGSVGLADGRAYFGHYGNAFVCVDLETMKLVWSYPGDQAFFSAPALAADRVVFGGRDKRVHCVRRADGTPLWIFRTARKVDASPVIAGERVVVGSGDGRLYLLDLADGREIWSYDVGRSIYSSPAVTAGRILVGANDGRLYAFGAPAGATPQASTEQGG